MRISLAALHLISHCRSEAAKISTNAGIFGHWVLQVRGALWAVICLRVRNLLSVIPLVVYCIGIECGNSV